MGGLQRLMRGRWRSVSELWDANKAATNKLNLLDQLDYMRKLSCQLEWQAESRERPIRLAYSTAGQPTAAFLGQSQVVTERLYWVTCRDFTEGHYLLAIINSNTLYNAAAPLMTKGQFGARDLHKHLWRLPIPEFEPKQKLHQSIAEAGERAAVGASKKLEELREERGEELTVTYARSEIRKWLESSKEGKAVETQVSKLLRS